jgi:hypothetical protein
MEWLLIIGFIALAVFVLNKQYQQSGNVKSQEEIENERAEKFEREMLEFEIREQVKEELEAEFRIKEASHERQLSDCWVEMEILATRLIDEGLDDDEMKRRLMKAGHGDLSLRSRYSIDG